MHLCRVVGSSVALAPDADATIALLAHVLDLVRIFEVLLAHRCADLPHFGVSLARWDGVGQLGQLAPLHHLPQQNTSTGSGSQKVQGMDVLFSK